MFVPLKIVSDYSLLDSLIKVDSLMVFLKNHNITACALVDKNLNGTIEFYNKCKINNIKPVIGLEVKINDLPIYLYAKNKVGYKTLLKLNTIIQKRELTKEDIILDNLKIIIPFKSIELFEFFSDSYIGYHTVDEENDALRITNKIVFVNEIKAYDVKDLVYLDYLTLVKEGKTIDELKRIHKFNYFPIDKISALDEKRTKEFINDINIDLSNNKRYIPVFENPFNDSYKYLEALTKKGLTKRFSGKVPTDAIKRLDYELSVIKNMGFVDYFLIVYDYVLYAKKNNILVGPGRGSAAGSLVSYSLGITDVYPLKYDLLFERFLNPERITMPDIDIDFEFTKRNDVINYVKEKYGKTKVAPIITYGTLASKQVIRDVAKMFKIDNSIIDKFVKEIDAKTTLLENSKKDTIKKFINNYPELKQVFTTSLKFEGLKRHTSTHAAGVVICSEELDNLIPVYLNNEELMTGITMEYLEDLGLLKMDFLALKNLTIISNVLELVKKNNKEIIELNKIRLNDERVYKLFQSGDTEGVFQFESSGMKCMLRKLKPVCFNDLVASIALFRPGPMENIEVYIKRKEGKEKIDYIDDSLKDILSETYGIIVYQEQIMQILVKMANYTFAEADNVRRAMSKKKQDVLEREHDKFVNQAMSNGYSKEVSEKVYELILKFANYGFNKAHSVAYALIGYQMACLKALYPLQFIQNLLNMSIGSEEKTKEYLLMAKKSNLEFLPVNINSSTSEYIVADGKILLPINVVKNIGSNAINAILKEREKGIFKDFCDFVARTYPLGINKLMLENLIKSSAFDSFGQTKKTLILSIPIAINYATLISDLDESLVMKPVLEESEEYQSDELRSFEHEALGFYLTNHPSSKYEDMVKIINIKSYFDRTIKMVVLIENIKKIKTKKNEDMAFITISDETGEIDATLFSNSIHLLNQYKKGDLVLLIGRVQKRFDRYNINIINLTNP